MSNEYFLYVCTFAITIRNSTDRMCDSPIQTTFKPRQNVICVTAMSACQAENVCRINRIRHMPWPLTVIDWRSMWVYVKQANHASR